MLNYLYMAPVLCDKPASTNQQDWRMRQHITNSEKIQTIETRMHEIINKIVAMKWLLFLASKDASSLISSVPTEITLLIMNAYPHVLLHDEQKKMPECMFFKPHEEERDQPENGCTVRLSQ